MENLQDTNMLSVSLGAIFLRVANAATAENGSVQSRTVALAMEENYNMLGEPVDWETCPLQNLLFRIMRLNRVLVYCRGRAADAYRPTQQERDRLIEIYSRRVKQQNSERK